MFKFRASTLAFITVLVVFLGLYLLVDRFAIPNGLNLVWILLLLVFCLAWLINRLVIAPRIVKDLQKKVNLEGQEFVVSDLKQRLRHTYWGELASYFWLFFALFVLRAFAYEPFKIPSGSMQPTLEIGDYIAVNKYHYRVADPLFQKTLWQRNPVLRGDVVVFKRPTADLGLSNEDWIKRVIGLPGDIVHYNEYTQKFDIITGCVTPKAVSRTYQWDGSALPTSSFYEGCKLETPVYTADYQPNQRYILFGKVLNQGQETLELNDGSRLAHKILQVPEPLDYSHRPDIFRQDEYVHDKVEGIPANTWVVPAGNYFVVGDNRDNSEDSRFIGFIPYENIVGRADKVVFSFINGQPFSFAPERFFLDIYDGQHKN